MSNNNLDLLTKLAEAWNTLSVSPLDVVFDENVVYESQWVFSTLNGKQSVLNYLEGKFSTIGTKAAKGSVEAKIGFLDGDPEQPCILLTQKAGDEIQKVSILIETVDSLITRIDLCGIPEPERIKTDIQ